MALYPTRLDAGEDYASVDDILGANDLPESTIHVPQWTSKGKPLAIRVRALSLAQREQIDRESTRRDGSIDTVVQIEATLREGVLVPRFDINTSARLRHKNGAALEQIASYIWALSALDQDLIDAAVQALADAAPPPADTSADAGDSARA
jgi:hypothetical protein